MSRLPSNPNYLAIFDSDTPFQDPRIYVVARLHYHTTPLTKQELGPYFQFKPAYFIVGSPPYVVQRICAVVHWHLLVSARLPWILTERTTNPQCFQTVSAHVEAMKLELRFKRKVYTIMSRRTPRLEL